MIEELKKAIMDAGKIIKENFYSHKDVKFKGEIDLLTKFDIEIENLLKERLSKIFPHYTIIGEESFKSEDISSPNRIYIDPIDGTTNFVHSIPFVAVSVGIYTLDSPHIGIVYNPILEEFFYAEKGRGAYLNGKRITCSGEKELKKALVATGFPYTIRRDSKDFSWNIEVVKKVLKNTLAFRRLGSAAIDLCYVARGSYDIFYEMGLKPWDVAAGILIVEEAGGRVSNDKNESFHLHKDSIIIATNSYLHDSFLTLLKGV